MMNEICSALNLVIIGASCGIDIASWRLTKGK
jgi:hypothetical protein